jgi:hypothetical protein
MNNMIGFFLAEVMLRLAALGKTVFDGITKFNGIHGIFWTGGA